MKLLGERKQKKKDAEENKQKAIEDNDMEKVLKYANQSVRISTVMIQDAIRLVELLGLPVVVVKIDIIGF
jgi:flap endonuclease-1